MSDLLKKLIEESSEEVDAEVEKTTSGTSDISGRLLIMSCIDWENASSRTAIGLDVPHTLRLPKLVNKVFSSSSSTHFFILLSDNISLMGVGKNDHGQLGLRNSSTQVWPVEVPHPIQSPIKKISTGKSHSLLLYENNCLYVCGSNACGQIGLGDGARGAADVTYFTKLTLDDVGDVACGWDHSLACTLDGSLYSFGHPDYGQLGLGSNGQFIREGGRGPAIQFNYITRPQKVTRFFSKETGKKSTIEIPKDSVKVVAVGAGKNHSLCIESWEEGAQNRVFSWGFGGYGRLGHNQQDDELYPLEIAVFSQLKNAPFKQIREVHGGNTFSLAVSVSRHVYFFGKLPNSPRGESQMYPKIQQELYDWSSHSVAAGSSCVLVAAAKDVVVWGVPVAGKFGVEGGGKNVSNPNFVESVKGLGAVSVSCGYGHCCMVVPDTDEASRARMDALPELTKEMTTSLLGSTAEAVVVESVGTKRGRPPAGEAKKKATVTKKRK